MSSDSTSVTNVNVDVDIQKVFMVVGFVMLFFIFLLILRYGCNMFIDVVIMRDSASFMRTLSEIRRRFVPWYHPRTQPQQEQEQQATTIQQTSSSADGESGQELINMDRILSGLTPQQKKDLLASILTTKVSDFHLDSTMLA
jgi:hypothetical protein